MTPPVRGARLPGAQKRLARDRQPHDAHEDQYRHADVQEDLQFLEKYLNNASPTGFEAEGQKIWLDYIRPYVDDYITDTYGSTAAITNDLDPTTVGEVIRTATIGGNIVPNVDFVGARRSGHSW